MHCCSVVAGAPPPHPVVELADPDVPVVLVGSGVRIPVDDNTVYVFRCVRSRKTRNNA